MDVAAIEREMDELLSNGFNYAKLLAEIEALDGDSMEEKLAILNQCDCCDRHQQNRPRNFVPWYDRPMVYASTQDRVPSCECDCRHMARFICRTCTDDSSPTQATIKDSWIDPTTTGITENVM